MGNNDREMYEMKLTIIKKRMVQLLKERLHYAREKARQRQANANVLERNPYLEKQIVAHGRKEGVISKHVAWIKRHERQQVVREAKLAEFEKLLKNGGFEEQAPLLNRHAEADGKVLSINRNYHRKRKTIRCGRTKMTSSEKSSTSTDKNYIRERTGPTYSVTRLRRNWKRIVALISSSRANFDSYSR